MSAARNRRNAHTTPISTPPPPSDDALRRVMDRRVAARIEELETENATLQAQLEEALARPALVQDETQVPNDTTAGTGSNNATLEESYEDLKTRYGELEARFERHRIYVDKATRKYEAARDSAKQWKEYVDKHLRGGHRPRVNPGGAQTPSIPAPPNLPRDVSDIDVTPRPQREVPMQPRETAHHHNVAREEPGDSIIRSAPPTTSNEDRSPPSPSTESKRITSSQTTEDDQPHIESPKIKHEPCSDEEPTVVREVNLKRRRGESPTKMPPPRRIKREPESPKRPGSAEQPIELRSEEFSSPVRNPRTLLRMETSDLDALRGTFQTPRKRRIMNDSRAVSEDRARTSFHPPTALSHNSSSLSDSDIPELPELPNASENTDGVQGKHQGLTGATHVTPKSKPSVRKALHQLSPNVPTATRERRSRRRISNEDAAKVGMLAEDDDETTSQVTPKAKDIPTKTPSSARLDAMLENPTPHRQPLPRKTPETTKRTNPRNPQIKPEPTSHTKPFPTTTATSATKPTRPPRLEKSPPPIDPASEPLRLKPLPHLRPQDFRINPSYANSTYAYNDPLNRKSKAARRCMPGCIDPSCCGEILEAARSGTLPPSTRSDAEVLENMLGPDCEKILAAYPQSEHRELLIQARAFEFSSEHGRHRKVFERAKTPPGFWRTDMPSTQEEAEDRRKADEMERARVEGMWREAMRGDGKGKWKFRDE